MDRIPFPLVRHPIRPAPRRNDFPVTTPKRRRQRGGAAPPLPWTLVAAAAVTAAAARLSSVGDYLALASFCLLATSSFIVLELYAVRAPAAGTQLAALRNWLEMHGNEVIIIVCLVLGVWLAGQSIRLLAIEGGR
jgi:hypothetical protein